MCFKQGVLYAEVECSWETEFVLVGHWGFPEQSEYFMGYTTPSEPTKYTVPLSDPGVIWDLEGSDSTPLWVSLW